MTFLHAVGLDFACPFCKVMGCCVAQENDGEKRRAVQHPDPPCDQFLKHDATAIAQAVGIDLTCRCEVIDVADVAPGWGCCSCRIYNGDWRVFCKHCGHGASPHPFGNKAN